MADEIVSTRAIRAGFVTADDSATAAELGRQFDRWLTEHDREVASRHHRVEYAEGSGVCEECSDPSRGTFKVWPCAVERKRLSS